MYLIMWFQKGWRGWRSELAAGYHIELFVSTVLAIGSEKLHNGPKQLR